MPAPPAQSSGQPNAYVLACDRARRFVDAQREIDLLRGVSRNAGEAAFASLMAGGGARLPTGGSPTPPPFATDAFERSVAATLIVRNGQLPLADRRELVRQAARLGLSRFDANLLMARVEHYARTAAPRPRRLRRRWPIRSRLLTAALVLVGLLILQGGLVLLWTLLLARGS